MNNILLLLIPIIIFFINTFVGKKKLIPNYSGEIHQRFFDSTNIPLSGGIFLLIITLFVLPENFFIFKFTILGIFFLGFLSDLNFLSSIRLRIFFQFLIIFLFIYISEVSINSIRIESVDIYLKNFWINLLFTSVCFLILINGSNFIDGLNGVIITYFCFIIYVLIILGKKNMFFPEDFKLYIFLVTLFTLATLNFFNKLYMGDSGSYLIGFLIGYLLVILYSENSLISPYFIALLLWYPVFEILFSILRKLKEKKSPFKPDNNHLHHLIFFFVQKKFKFPKNLNNNFASIFINSFNFLIFNIAILKIYISVFQVFLIIVNITCYILLYYKLFNFKKINI